MLLKHSEQLAAHQPPTSHGMHTVFWEVLCVLCFFCFFPKARFSLVGSLLVPALSELMSLPSFGLPSW